MLRIRDPALPARLPAGPSYLVRAASSLLGIGAPEAVTWTEHLLCARPPGASTLRPVVVPVFLPAQSSPV